ncbi:hypothetical protein D9M68_943930 [compost metagenome]
MCKAREQQERAAEHVLTQRFAQFLGKRSAACFGDGVDFSGRFAVLLLGAAADQPLVLEPGQRRIDRAIAGFHEIGEIAFRAHPANVIAARIPLIENG